MGEFLLVTIQVDMHDQLALTLQDDLTAQIAATGAKGVLIDISALEMVDSFIGRMIANISAHVAHPRRARRWSSACSPAVAITLVELGLSPGRRATRRSTSSAACALLRRPPSDRSRSMPITKTDVAAAAHRAGHRARPPGACARLTQELGFGLVDQTKMVTAASELARNTVVYGGGGDDALGDR